MTNLHHIIYTSTCDHTFTDGELIDLLNKSKLNNKANGITGILICSNKNVFQVIEGTEESLNKLYVKLEDDTRHHSLIKLADKPIPYRSFTEWTMAYKPLVEDRYQRLLAGYTLPQKLCLSPPEILEADAMLLTALKYFIP